jgi:putative transposase
LSLAALPCIIGSINNNGGDIVQKDRYRKGAHTVTDLQYHYVWKTKYSYNILKGPLALRLREIIMEICAENKMNIEKGNVRPNHVHILVSAPSYLSPSKMAQYLKGKSSYRLQREFPQLEKRYWGRHIWSRGYFCSTVGAVTEDQIKQYIENQSDESGKIIVWDESDLPDSQ